MQASADARTGMMDLPPAPTPTSIPAGVQTSGHLTEHDKSTVQRLRSELERCRAQASEAAEQANQVMYDTIAQRDQFRDQLEQTQHELRITKMEHDMKVKQVDRIETRSTTIEQDLAEQKQAVFLVTRERNVAEMEVTEARKTAELAEKSAAAATARVNTLIASSAASRPVPVLYALT